MSKRYLLGGFLLTTTIITIPIMTHPLSKPIQHITNQPVYQTPVQTPETTSPSQTDCSNVSNTIPTWGTPYNAHDDMCRTLNNISQDMKAESQ